MLREETASGQRSLEERHPEEAKLSWVVWEEMAGPVMNHVGLPPAPGFLLLLASSKIKHVLSLRCLIRETQ